MCVESKELFCFREVPPNINNNNKVTVHGLAGRQLSEVAVPADWAEVGAAKARHHQHHQEQRFMM